MRAASIATALAIAACGVPATLIHAAAPTAAGATGQAGDSDTELTEVTITGSRVIMNGNDAPTPVTVVSVEDIMVTKPTTLYENLASLPVFSGNSSAGNNPNDKVDSGGSSVVGLNLRNLGGLRALVLYDGHRVPPTTADGFVDVNMLPQMLLQRAEVVTGGASAVYGSDAVTGVINFITDTKFKGVKANVQTGISRYNDDRTYEVGIAGGNDLFGGRGHIEGSYQRHSDAGILHRLLSGRAWTEPGWTLQGNGTTIPWHLQDNVRIVSATFGGRIVCPQSGFTAPCTGNQSNGGIGGYTGSLVGYTFDDNGVLTPFETGPSGTAAGLTQGSVQIGGDGAYHAWPQLKSSSRLDQFFGRFDYDVAEQTHLFVAASGAVDRLEGNSAGLRSFGQGWNIGACNAFLSQAYQTALGCTAANAANPPVFKFSKLFNGIVQPGEPGGTDLAQTHTYFVNAGLEGKFGSGYRWEASYTHSQARMNNRISKIHHMGPLFAALDAVVNPANGQVVCNVTLTNPGLYPGCVPINLFGPTAATVDAINYIFGPIDFTATNKLDGIAGSVAGAPLHSWAGPIDVALSGEFRRQTYDLASNSEPSSYIPCTGLRFGNCVANTYYEYLNTYTPRSPVRQSAAEAAVEFGVPLLKDRALFKDLSLNTAGRYTHYDNNPNDPLLAARTISAITWKAGLTWEMTRWLTVRTARSRDIRAPNLYDLYTPVAVTPNSITIDYLQPNTPNTSPALQSGGNPDLQPEISHTTTLGFVLRPTAGFSMAIDAYDIKIVNALASINGMSQDVQLACYRSGGTSPLCQLQERPFGCCTNTTSANALTKVYNRRVNIAVQKAWGIDYEMNYATRIRERAFSVRTLVTWQPHLIYSQETLPTNDQAGAGYSATYGLLPTPIWKATLFTHFNVTEALAIDLSERYRSRMRLTADPTQSSIGGIASVAYTNLNLSWSLRQESHSMNVFLNVQNLFDKDPPPAANPAQAFQPGLTSNGYAFGDDQVGRYYSLGVRVRL